MRRLLAVASVALALAPALAAAEGGGNGVRHTVTVNVADPLADESTRLELPVAGPWGKLADCHDPSLDILSVAAAASRRSLHVEVVHAAPVLAPRLSCAGTPVAAANQRYALSIEGDGGSFLFLNVDAGEACLYVLFAEPAEVSDCLQGAQVDGAVLALDAALRGTAPVGDGKTRNYQISGTLVVHAFNQETAGTLPPVPFVPNALLLVEDASDTDAVLVLGH